MERNGKYTITATCASGIEKVLKSELKRLGYGEPPVVNGACSFEGGLIDVARCNVFLRTADRVYITLKEFTVQTFDELFENALLFPWEEFIVKDGLVVVNGNCVKSKLFAISACQGIIKKAIAKRLCEKNKINFLPEDGSVYEVDFYIYKDVVSLRLNTSGAGLHKRGYKDKVWIAPIKETLASALLLMSDFYYARPLIDPFCGSGTIITEGAMIALDIAPNKTRKFAFNDWTNFDKKIIGKVLEEACDKEKRERNIDFRGYDIDGKAISLSNRHAERAGISDKVKFYKQDVKDLSLKGFGTIVTNPPYGERVYGKDEARECYKALGKKIKEAPEFSAFIITSANGFERDFGKKADRVRKLYNSEKECNYYFYYGKA